MDLLRRLSDSANVTGDLAIASSAVGSIVV